MGAHLLDAPRVITPQQLCANLDDAPPKPHYMVVPKYQDGQEQIITTYDCKPDGKDYLPIHYKIDGDIMWDPPLPSTFGLYNGDLRYRRFTSQPYVNVKSDDNFGFCTGGRVDLQGPVTWVVADTRAVTKSYNLDVGKFISSLTKFVESGNAIGGAGCKQSPSMVNGFTVGYSETTKQKCCGDGTIGTTTSQSVSAKFDSFGETCTTPALPIWGGALLLSGSVSVNISGKISGSIQKDSCYYNSPKSICLTDTISGKLTGKLELAVINPSILKASASLSVTVNTSGTLCFIYNSDGSIGALDMANSNFSFGWGPIVLTGVATELGGFEQKIEVTLAN